MHDKPGSLKLDVNDPNFEQELKDALLNGYTVLASVANFLVLVHGYS